MHRLAEVQADLSIQASRRIVQTAGCTSFLVAFLQAGLVVAHAAIVVIHLPSIVLDFTELDRVLAEVLNGANRLTTNTTEHEYAADDWMESSCEALSCLKNISLRDTTFMRIDL